MKIMLSLLVPTLLMISTVSQAAELIAVKPEEQKLLGITTAQPASIASDSSTAMPAHVTIPPANERVIATPESARIVSFEVATDDEVVKDQVLATVASAALLSLQKDYLQALTEFNLASNQLKRDRLLADEGIIATKRLQESSTRYNNQKIHLQTQQSALEITGFSTTDIQQLKKTGKLQQTLNLRSPMTGIVLEKMVNVGARIEAGDPVFRVADLSQLWLEIRVPLESTALITENSVFQVEGRPITARLLRISKNVDTQSQTVVVRAEIVSGVERIRPGEVVNVRHGDSGQAESTLLVLPRKAVVHSGDQDYVFLQADGGFNATQVTVKGHKGDQVIIAQGLKQQDVVAVTGIVSLKAAWMGIGGGE